MSENKGVIKIHAKSLKNPLVEIKGDRSLGG
jgi:hypothetical protein